MELVDLHWYTSSPQSRLPAALWRDSRIQLCLWVRLRRQNTVLVIASIIMGPQGYCKYSHGLYLQLLNLSNLRCQTSIKNCWVMKISQSSFWLIWWSYFFWCLVFSDGHRYSEIKKTLRIMFNLPGNVSSSSASLANFHASQLQYFGAQGSPLPYSKYCPFDIWTALIIRTFSLSLLSWNSLFVTNFSIHWSYFSPLLLKNNPNFTLLHDSHSHT